MKKTFDVTRDAVKVRLRVGKFRGYRTSKQLRNEAAKKHQADEESITGGVKLLRREDVRLLESIVSQARNQIAAVTWTWEDGALCPVENYAALEKMVGELEREFLDAAGALVGRYDELVKDAKGRLNGLAATHRFPTQAEFRDKFYWRFCTDRVTDPAEVTFNGISREAQARIKGNITERVEEQLNEAQAEVIARLTETIAHVKEQLTGTNGKKSKVVTKALWKNLADTLDVLPTLNIFGDAKVNELIEMAKSQIAAVAVEDVQKDKKLRKALAADAETILSDLANFGIGGGK